MAETAFPVFKDDHPLSPLSADIVLLPGATGDELAPALADELSKKQRQAELAASMGVPLDYVTICDNGVIVSSPAALAAMRKCTFE